MLRPFYISFAIKITEYLKIFLRWKFYFTSSYTKLFFFLRSCFCFHYEVIKDFVFKFRMHQNCMRFSEHSKFQNYRILPDPLDLTGFTVHAYVRILTSAPLSLKLIPSDTTDWCTFHRKSWLQAELRLYTQVVMRFSEAGIFNIQLQTQKQLAWYKYY